MSAKDPAPTLFATTRWTLIVDAARGSETEAIAALDELLKIYWRPLYRYARRKGKTKEDAEDLVQGFMLQLVQGQSLARAEPEKGRFRAYLLTCFNHWMTNEWRHATRQKRGGHHTHLSFDWESAESGLKLDLPDERTPTHHFDREWALALLSKVLGDLEASCREEGHGDQFDRLKVCLTTESASIPYGEIAASMGVTEGAVRVAVHRLRKRYRSFLLKEIERTLSSPEAAQDELQALFSALSV